MGLKTMIAASAVTLAAGGLALAATPFAYAGVTSSTSTTDGMAGYFGNALGVSYKSLEATWDLTPQAENIGTTTSLASPQGALGAQLCSNSTRGAAEIGTTYNGGGTFSVDYAAGHLPSNNSDPCVNNGILHNGGKLHPLLSAIPEGDSITALLQEEKHGVVFSAQDDKTGRSFSVWVSCGGHWAGKHHYVYNSCEHYNEPGVGVQQNLTQVGGAATNDLVDFAGVKVDTSSTASPSTPLGNLNDITVDSSGTGNPNWLVGPANSITTGPNGEACTASLSTTLQTPNIPALPQPQYGPLTSGEQQFSICAATATGA